MKWHTIFVLEMLVMLAISPFAMANITPVALINFSHSVSGSPAQDSQIPQMEKNLSGIWDGSLSFNFDGEIVGGHLTLIIRQHQNQWSGELILTAKDTTSSAYLPEFQYRKDSFSFQVIIRKNAEIALNASLKNNNLKGKIQLFISNKVVGESTFNLTKPKKLINILYAIAGQRPDPNFKPPVENPAYPHGKGPEVLIDEAHNNFHTMEGRYKSFADLLKRDGYVVRPNKSSFERGTLKNTNILVISNAVSDQNKEDWPLPAYSAFKDDEIAYIRDLVCEGGALLLIADHMPFP